MLLSLLSGDFTRDGLLFMVITLLLRVPAVLFSLSVHETAHGFVACKLGDPTAKNLGRLTLNPIKHIDPFGAVSMLIFGIGWAKPVPIFSRNFKKPKRDMALTAAAGPLSNLLVGVVAIVLLFVGARFFIGSPELSFISNARELGGSYGGMFSVIYFVIMQNAFSVGLRIAAALLYLLLILATLNFSLALFNLIPVPPFDGSRIAFVLLPDKYYFAVMKYERFIMIGFLILFFVGSRLGWFDGIFSGFINLFFTAFSWIL